MTEILVLVCLDTKEAQAQKFQLSGSGGKNGPWAREPLRLRFRTATFEEEGIYVRIGGRIIQKVHNIY
jgi:hypothetical protein